MKNKIIITFLITKIAHYINYNINLKIINKIIIHLIIINNRIIKIKFSNKIIKITISKLQININKRVNKLSNNNNKGCKMK